MFRNTFLGAMIRWVISHTAWLLCQLPCGWIDDSEWRLLTVSKSMDVNLKRRRKKGGIRMVVLRCELDIVPENVLDESSYY